MSAPANPLHTWSHTIAPIKANYHTVILTAKPNSPKTKHSGLMLNNEQISRVFLLTNPSRGKRPL